MQQSSLRAKLPVSYLLFSPKGRINRSTYWILAIFIWSAFYGLYNVFNYFSESATWILYPLLFWAIIATGTKRLHDSSKSGHWLWIVFIPLLGPLILVYLLGIRRSSASYNRFGAKPNSAADYYKNPAPEIIPHLKTEERIINDVTQLNPVIVKNTFTPNTITELQQFIAQSDTPVCVGGGRFSMGGQTASSQTTFIDMRKLNKVLDFNPSLQTIQVESGIRWCDIQQHIDPYNLSLSIMQTYANFTVGGSLSVNCHGRYVGQGPLILSVLEIEILLANGTFVIASEQQNQTFFYAAIGCYNAIGIITRVKLQLSENVLVKRLEQKMPLQDYLKYFSTKIRNQTDIIFHNADIYPPAYKNIRAVSWVKTNDKPTDKTRLMPLAGAYPIERYFIGAFSRSNFRKWQREYIIDPILYASKKVRFKNYEAGYDVLELEPKSRLRSTYVLQEYFVPFDQINTFAPKMASIFQKYKANIINISIRHAHQDKGSLLAWAKQEVFAYVVWYKQGTTNADKEIVAEWTRAMLDLVIEHQGSYYLPYQAHASQEQFYKAYPNAKQLFSLKQKYDPHFRFKNVLWDKYYKTYLHELGI